MSRYIRITIDCEGLIAVAKLIRRIARPLKDCTLMTIAIPDIYIHHANGSVAIQGATQAAIDLLKARYTLQNGTTALVAPEEAEEAFALIDDAGLQTLTF